MANPEHVELVKLGAQAIADWQLRFENATLDLSGANLSGINLTGTRLTGANFSGADLSDAELRQIDLTNADMSNANLSFANLNQSRILDADFPAANLSGAFLSDSDLFDNDFSDANLTDAKLGGVRLNGSTFDGAVLIRVDFHLADLSETCFSEADLTEANLTEANLTNADFENAKLFRTNLHDCRFMSTRLRNTDFTDSTLGSGSFNNTDLSSVIGLETIHHRGPTSVGVDTLWASQGKIPEVFLRDCGVPEDLITFLPSLIDRQSPIQFYSCFISYSHRDEEFCKRLHARMQQEKLRVWYAPEDMASGKKIHEQIDSAIRVHDKLLLVLSEKSMKSEWVATEIYKARKRETTERRQLLFPIRLCSIELIQKWECFDADTGKDMAREIREYLIPDFSNWKDHDAFEAGFDRLMRDLRKAGEKK
jgi:uncharacterized protein YjbI with pentapeptide repeats